MMRVIGTGVVLAVVSQVYWSGRIKAQDTPVEQGISAKAEPSLFVKSLNTPDEKIRAMIVSMQIRRPDLARNYLVQLMEESLDVKTLSELRIQFGPAALLRLEKTKLLQPEIGTFVAQINDAFQQHARSPERIAGLLPYLSASKGERAWAAVQLREAGSHAVPVLIDVLRDQESVKETNAARYALRNLGVDATAPLIAALQSPDLMLKREVIDLVTDRGDRTAVPFLWEPALSGDSPESIRQAARAAIRYLSPSSTISRESAVRNLLKSSEQYRDGSMELQTNLDGDVDLWMLGEGPGGLVVSLTSEKKIRLLLSLHMVQMALNLAPDRSDTQRSLLRLLLLQEDAESRFGDPVRQDSTSAWHLVSQRGTPVLKGVLDQALLREEADVAEMALRLMKGFVAQLTTSTTEQIYSMLHRAITFPDRRVQFAAAELMVALKPSDSFRGSSAIMQVLSRAILSSGSEKAIVIDSIKLRGQRLAAMARDIGFDTEVAVSGKQGFQLAVASADVEVIVVDLNVIRWSLTETLENLRKDPRTAGLPIYLVGPLEWVDVQSKFNSRFGSIEYLVRPSSSEDLRLQMQAYRSFQKETRDPLSVEEHAHYALRAIRMMYAIASGECPLGDPRRSENALLDVARRGIYLMDVLPVLGQLATSSSQATLVQVLINNNRDEETRLSALQNLSLNIGRNGVLLGTQERVGLRQVSLDELPVPLRADFTHLIQAL